MEFRVHQKLRKTIQDEQRDIALITAPGMGLSTLLKSIPDTHEVRRVYINVRKLENLWETEFKSRSHNKRFVIHSATISALIESNLVQSELTAEAIYHTNLRSFLNENQNCFANVEKTFVVIDNFDKLPNELEKMQLISANSIQINSY